jgi:hypothetical protein
MARPETLFDAEVVCMAKIFKERGVETKCSCPTCAGKPKVGRPKCVEFPELLKNAVKEDK